MAQAALTSPLTLDPTEAVTLRLRRFVGECDARVVQVTVVMLDAGGNIVGERTIQADSAAVKTWLTNQETTILNALLNKLGISGTIT
jgi:hypothetical protein